MSNLIEMKSLDINGNKFECVDDYARKQIKAIMNNEIVVTIDDVFKCNMGHASSGESFPMESLTPDENGYAIVAKVEVKKGDVLRNNSGKTYVYCFYMLDTNNVCVYTARYSMLNDDMYTIPCDGTLVMECTIDDATLPICVIEKAKDTNGEEEVKSYLPLIQKVTVGEFKAACFDPNSDMEVGKFFDFNNDTIFKEERYSSSFYGYLVEIKKGEIISTAESGELWWMWRFNKEGYCTYDYRFEGTQYIAEEDGFVVLEMNGSWIEGSTDVKFSIERNIGTGENLVSLRADKSELYKNDSYYGDLVLDAILNGKQVLVRVLNKGDSKLYANFMPIFQYQLPDENNDYLTLLHFEDGMAQNIATAMATGSFDGVYGEIDMKLSKTYSSCPL